jgi:hypothetical protein
LVQRQEIVDEEKRTRIEALRRSGQIVESRKSHDIPFGVRAIQSGIQVDGIWISNGSSPIPSELKLEHEQGESDTTEGEGSRARAKTPAEVPQQPSRPSSRQGRPVMRTLSSGMPPWERSPDPASSERPGSAGNRTSYKPRKSSHLRYGSYGETRYDKETLGHLEGHPSPKSSPKTSPKKKPHTHRLRGSQQIEREADSSAADNEHSSGTSSDSDATLSNKVLLKDRKHESTVVQPSNLNFGAPTLLAYAPSNRATRSSFPVQSSKAEYFSIPRDSPGYESDPFATPHQSPMDHSPLVHPTVPGTEPSTDLGEDSRLLYQSQNRPPSPFVPGELHLNRVVRKVNSGFQVLPAGTFGVPASLGAKDSEVDEHGNSNDDTGDRRQSKLQKKRPQSTTPKRPSSTMERP